MPTVGWILEGATDRFLQSVPARLQEPRIRYDCARCGAAFATPGALSLHLGLEHPQEVPTLYLNGLPATKETTVRQPLPESSLELINCTTCRIRVDGGEWRELTPRALQTEASRSTNANWQLWLSNVRDVDGSDSASTYSFSFRIPRRDHIDAIDGFFVETLAKEGVTHQDLKRFESFLPSDVPAREYGAALGDYALALLLKDKNCGPESLVQFREFAEKMQAALAVLRWFRRPVPLAATSCIRFNLNDFCSQWLDPVPLELAPALTFFRAILVETHAIGAAAPPEQRVSDARPVCPLDSVSSKILEICRIVANRELSDSSQYPVLATMLATPKSADDMTKLQVLSAVVCMNAGANEKARFHLASIEFDHVFGNWAGRKLREIESA